MSLPSEIPLTQERPGTAYPIIPAAGFHWLTPCYNFFCMLFSLGRSFQRGGVAIWHHDAAGKVHAGENSLKNAPEISLHGDAVDSLFQWPE
jgi:hypothetical protein